MAKGWRIFCAANNLRKGETFTLEFVRGQGLTPMLKFCSKAKVKVKVNKYTLRYKFLVLLSYKGVNFCIKMNRIQIEKIISDDSGGTCKALGVEEEETETRVQKRARVSAERGPSSRTFASNKSSADPKKLQHK